MNVLADIGPYSDAFAAGLLAGVVENKSLDESIDMGQWLASLSIKELGPSYVISFIFSSIIAFINHKLTSINPSTHVFL